MSGASEPASGRPETPELRPRILICDDQDDVRRLILASLGPDYECLATSSASEALARARDFRPDLFVCDVLMPGVDGFALCRSVRADPELAPVPFVLLTCVADPESRTRGLECGADDYLVKPIRRRELLARVESLLRMRRTLSALEERTRELEDANRTLALTQASLVRAEKLATVGTLVAGVAHEINNPLSVIKSGAAVVDAMLAELGTSLSESAGRLPAEHRQLVESVYGQALSEIRSVLGEVAEGTGRLQRVAADLRTFAEGERAPVEEVDLSAEVERAWRLARLKAAFASHLVYQPEKLECVHSVRHLVSQVLVNVLQNAAEAAGPGGRVHVSLGATEAGVSVEITDTGPGIPPEHQPRVFDPFFTTKLRPQAAGLGLSVAYGIMRSLGGRIEVASPDGEGATFRIHLPRWSPGADGHELSPAGQRAPRRPDRSSASAPR
jgi:two-component system, NtrC family, sensor kinase